MFPSDGAPVILALLASFRSSLRNDVKHLKCYASAGALNSDVSVLNSDVSVLNSDVSVQD